MPRNRIWACLAPAAVCLLFAGLGGEATGEEARMEILRVMTINLRNDSDFVEKRMPLLADEIARWRPHLIGLQEVRITYEQMEKLTELVHERLDALGLSELRYSGYQQYKSGLAALTGEGIGIMSLMPMENRKTLDLDYDLERHGRIAQHVEVRLGAGAEAPGLHFYNAHLHHRGEHIRVRQAEMLLDFIEGYGSGNPAVLVGDLNATPDSESIGLFLERFGDAYAELWPDEEPEGFTFPTPLPINDRVAESALKRIDYIFHAPGGAGIGLEPVRAAVCFKQEKDGIYPSDHYGVVADFEVPGVEGLIPVPAWEQAADQGDEDPEPEQ